MHLDLKGTKMNKAITDGVVFMPPAFEEGLSVWSSEDGTPGSDTYEGASPEHPNVAIHGANPVRAGLLFARACAG